MKRQTIRTALIAMCSALAIAPARAASAAEDGDEAAAVAAPSATDPKRAQIHEGVARLIEDAGRIEDFNPKGPLPHLRRPHPALAGWDASMTDDVLDRMLKPFTGNAYLDTYIRWHLMWVVRKCSQQQIRDVGPKLKSLIDRMPSPISGAGRAQYRYEPPGTGEELFWRHYRLSHAGDITIGIPPFDRTIGPPESFKYMSEAQIAAAKAKIEEAKTLEGKFERIFDPEARAFNLRIAAVNSLIREYRGELIYALIWTGDPKMASQVMKAIDRHVRNGSGIAIDLINYLYRAVFSGVLEFYDPQLRGQMSKQLKATAKAAEGWSTYGGWERNIADYAFHLVQMLADETLYATDQTAPKASRRPWPDG